MVSESREIFKMLENVSLVNTFRIDYYGKDVECKHNDFSQNTS